MTVSLLESKELADPELEVTNWEYYIVAFLLFLWALDALILCYCLRKGHFPGNSGGESRSEQEMALIAIA